MYADEGGIVGACVHPLDRPNASPSALSTVRRNTRHLAATPRNASKSSRTFAQSGLCSAKNRPLNETRQAMRSPVWTDVRRASSCSLQVAFDTRRATHVANKTAVKKIFCFRRVDQVPRRMLSFSRRAHHDLRRAQRSVGGRREFFFVQGVDSGKKRD